MPSLKRLDPTYEIAKCKSRLLGGAAFIGLVAALAGHPQRAAAACAVTLSTVTCDATVTTDDINLNAGENPSSKRDQQFSNPGDVSLAINAGQAVTGFGLNTTLTAAGNITATHSGSVKLSAGTPNVGVSQHALGLSAEGSITYSGDGSIDAKGQSGARGLGILAGGTATASIGTGAITAAATGISLNGGIVDLTLGTGAITAGGPGIRAIGGTVSIRGPAAISAGLEGIRALSGALTVDVSGPITAGTSGIYADIFGQGTIDITVRGPITAGSDGIVAVQSIKGNNDARPDVAVTTTALGTIGAEGNGIRVQANGTVSIVASGAIGQGTAVGLNGIDISSLQGQGGGGGEKGGDKGGKDDGKGGEGEGEGEGAFGILSGNVSVTASGTINAAGNGIRVDRTGGNTTILASGAIGQGTAVGGNGIDATINAIEGIEASESGVLNITANALVNATGIGINAVNHGKSGSINVAVGAGAVVAALGGAGVNLTGGLTNTVTNSGLISGVVGLQTSAGTTTVTNAGGITGTGGTAVQFGGANNLFIMEGPNAALGGLAIGSGSDTFRLAGSGANTFDVSQIGAGWTAFEKTGGSTWTITGTATYAGPTVVNEGKLVVNGSLASSSGVTINPGGILGGSGILPSVTLNGGTLSPGNSIGTINIGGNLTFVGAGNYIVEVSPTSSDRTNVTGTATLAGTVHAVFLPGAYLERTYTILSAGQRSGTFSTLATTDLPAGFTADLSYTGTEAILNLTAVLGVAGLQPLPPGGLNVNQRNAATSLNTYFNNGGVLPSDFVAVFGLTGNALTFGLTQLSGEVGTGAATVGFRATDQFLSVMLDPFLENRAGGAVSNVGGPALSFAPEDDAALAYGKGMPRKAPPLAPTFEQRWTVWGAGYGGHGSFDGDSVVIGSNNLSVNTAGAAGGVDYRFGQSVIGAALTGQSLSYRLDAGLGSGSGDAVQAGLYGSTTWGNAYVSAALSLGWYDLDTTRLVLLPGVTNSLIADISATSIGGRIEGGYRVPVWRSSGVTPYAALQAMSFHTGAYAETGPAGANAFALTYAANTTNDVRSELGLRVDTRMAIGETSMLILRGRAAWAHAFDNDRSIGAVFQALPGAGFTVFGASPAENAALLSAGGELRLANGLSLLAKFDREFGGDTTAYAGSGALRYAW